MRIWRLDWKKKIDSKINKTLKSFESTEEDPAASSGSLAQKDSLLPWTDIQLVKPLRGRPWMTDNSQSEQNKTYYSHFRWDTAATGRRHATPMSNQRNSL